MKTVVIGNSIVNGFPLKRSRCFTSLLRTKYGIETINKGVNGDTTKGILLRFEEDALKSGPDLILLLTGTNDFITGGSVSDAVKNVKAMLDLAGDTEVTALSPLLTHPALAARMWMRADYNLVNEKLKEFKAELEKIMPVIDTQSAYADFAENVSAREAYIDCIHPGEEGHEVLAAYIAEKLEKR